MTVHPAEAPLFEASAAFNPDSDFAEFLKFVPAKWVVYLLADESDRPIQLLCVKNLRYSLKRRLGGEEQVGPTRRVNYRDLVRRIYYRRVDSAFEADWVYYLAARNIFPQTYRGMTGFRPAWFVHVNPAAKLPRYTKTIDLLLSTGTLVGPLEDKHAASRLIDEVEDAFDLCRYYNILVEYPNGSACAYKGMGKCPAPCDGTISIEQYRRLVEMSLQALVDPRHAVREHSRRMQQVAAELRFELAAKIKQYVDQLGKLYTGAFAHVRRLSEFQFIAIQRGPREGTAKIFLILAGAVLEPVSLIAEPHSASDLIRHLLELAETAPTMTQQGAELIGVVSHHLFLSKQSSGFLLRLDAMDDTSLVKAFRALQKQKVKEVVDEDEGLVKELQSAVDAET